MSPEFLLEALSRIFPSFRAEWEDENPYVKEDGSFTRHSVFLTFTPFFGMEASRATEKQLRALAEVVNLAVEMGGDTENAVSTCFLEHLHQVGGVKYLIKFLSIRARAEVRA